MKGRGTTIFMHSVAILYHSASLREAKLSSKYLHLDVHDK
jgi:hypothetical protein